MKEIHMYSNYEIERLSSDEKRIYFETLKKQCEELKIKKTPTIGQKLISKIYPLLRNYDFEIIGEENIPQNDSALFVCNHSNSHDIFTAYEIMEKLSKSATVMVASDCLSLPVNLLFQSANATMIDRRDKNSSTNGMLEISKKIIEGKCGVIFGESTWNLHPYLPMQTIKMGTAKIGAITQKIIIPTIFEYVEVPDLCKKESELYTKCIVYFGQPIKINTNENLLKQTIYIQHIMESMRRNIWKKLNIKRDSLNDVNQELYLNHTYIKKFKALGFTYDTESESKFLFAPKGQNPINEYCVDENGRFTPGITKKK